MSENQKSHLKNLYRQMLRIRLVEEEIARRYYPEQEMRCPVHLSIGQEAIAVGISDALLREDQIVSTHRCHAHYLAKGGDLKAMIAEIYGKASGCCGGRGGSMHLIDKEAGVFLSLPIVGSNIPIGVGVALSFQQEQKRNVSVIYFGDGAIEEGVFHESANFAKLMNLPVLFVCENNMFSVYTHLDQRQPSYDMTRFAKSHLIESFSFEGNDVRQIAKDTKPIVENIRNGNGPAFIQLNTYRHLEHCGPENDDHLGYRSPEELELWKAKCPIEITRAQLFESGALSESENASMTENILSEIQQAFEFAKSSPFPMAETLRNHLYA